MNYEIVGSPYPAVVCHLQQGEQMKTESGSMVWMDPAMTMETKGGGIGKMFGKAFTGESLFQNIYTATQPGKIAFASSFPGTIVPLQIGPGREFVVQKQSFLAGEAGVEISVHFNERIGSGFFGGEGFIMQRLSGQGMAFVEVDGSLVQYELAPGQQLIVDTGNVMGFSLGVDIRIQRVKGAKNIFLGGEGLFHTVLTGPGIVWLQTMPLAGFVDSIRPYFASSNS